MSYSQQGLGPTDGKTMLRNLGFIPKAVGSHRRILSSMETSDLPFGKVIADGLEELELDLEIKSGRQH